MNIRLARPADCAALAELCRRCIPQPWSAASFESELEKGSFAVVAEEERIVGFAVLGFDGDFAYLHLLAVDDGFRRRGIARSLMERVHAAAKSSAAERILLEVRQSNSTAQALYAALGYEKLAVRHGFYSDPREDGITMQKVIK